jgi:sensor histidine kinase YesM
LEKSLTNPKFPPTEPEKESGRINDIGFRLILIPFFGLVIPLITGMYSRITLSHWQMKLSGAYCIGIALVIWEGNRYLLFTLRSYFNWFNQPLQKILALLLAISFYSLPLSWLLLIGWYRLFADGHADGSVIFNTALLILVCVLFITHVYETVFLVRESESGNLRNEQLRKAKEDAELQALKNQLDPHFLFNSLNTLSHLIEEDPARARQYNDHMADVFRYLLDNKSRNLVLLREEIQFLSDYFFLLKIRFEQAIELELPAEGLDQWLIPPITLQILAENAIKHNRFSADQPLRIRIFRDQDSLRVCNRCKPRRLYRPSSGIGLKNLAERYRLITDRTIRVDPGVEEFTVTVPIVRPG